MLSPMMAAKLVAEFGDSSAWLTLASATANWRSSGLVAEGRPSG